MFHLDADNVYRSRVLDDVRWLEHGFGTRLESDWPPRDRVTSVRQVHSSQVVVADGRPGMKGEGDALITNRTGVLLSIRTADCLPILIADMQNRAVAAIHAGWRGTAAEIAIKTVQAMQREYGSLPAALRVAIGPGIGMCCFEIGPEVAVQFDTLFPERHDLGTRTNLDLVEANRRQLTAAGVWSPHLEAAQLCTFCNGTVFHSYRRDGERAGRMVAAIGISG